MSRETVLPHSNDLTGPRTRRCIPKSSYTGFTISQRRKPHRSWYGLQYHSQESAVSRQIGDLGRPRPARPVSGSGQSSLSWAWIYTASSGHRNHATAVSTYSHVSMQCTQSTILLCRNRPSVRLSKAGTVSKQMARHTFRQSGRGIILVFELQCRWKIQTTLSGALNTRGRILQLSIFISETVLYEIGPRLLWITGSYK